ncbi:MAG: BlaI/MecI/CopY family transcriptional regulator [Clostridia bacterium]|nr:BlaI/MecI/CopY family transcriptional regulator [Clostridia bacterium]
MEEQENVALYPSERRIMECLWRESPRTIVGVWHALEDETGWSKSTVNTLLGRMVEKGIIRYKEGRRAREYYPCVAKDEAAVAETRSLLERVYRGSVGLMMTTLVEKDELTKEEIEELYDILRKAEEAKRQ